MSDNHSERGKEELAKKGRLVSECMLSNSIFTVIGVGIGCYFGLKRKHLRPFVYSISFGTLADMLYGYTNSCRAVIDDYESSKRYWKGEPLLVEKKINVSPNDSPDNVNLDTTKPSSKEKPG